MINDDVRDKTNVSDRTHSVFSTYQTAQRVNNNRLLYFSQTI